jgi:hypothetical protein
MEGRSEFLGVKGSKLPAFIGPCSGIDEYQGRAGIRGSPAFHKPVIQDAQAGAPAEEDAQERCGASPQEGGDNPHNDKFPCHTCIFHKMAAYTSLFSAYFRIYFFIEGRFFKIALSGL